MAIRSLAAGRSNEQHLSFDVLRDWFCGTVSDQDPLALPFRLAIQRFCPYRRFGDFADEFDESLHEFSLSHAGPAELPEDNGASVDSRDLLNRAEVAYLDEVLHYCYRWGRLRLTMEDLDHVSVMASMNMNKRMMASVCAALESVSSEMLREAKSRRTKLNNRSLNSVSLTDIARRVCPLAQPKHLRMFECWAKDYHNLQKQKQELQDLEDATDEFRKNENKPFLPQSEVDALEREFKKLDLHDRGYITLDDICYGWGWSEELCRDTLGSFDIEGDGCIDRFEFMRMMCPGNCRLPEMSGSVRDMFGNFLASEFSEHRRSVDTRDAHFTDTTKNVMEQLPDAPLAAFPIVEGGRWETWQQVFSSLDLNGDGVVQVSELMSSGLLSASASRAVATLIEPEDKGGFRRKGFLKAMLKSHERRGPPGWEAQCLDA